MGLLFISTNEPGRFSSFEELKSKSLCQSFGHLFGHNSPIRVCQEWKWQMSRLCQSWNFDETIFKGENSPQKKPFKPFVICDHGRKNSFSNMIYHHHRTHVTLSINWKIATTFKLPNSWGYTQLAKNGPLALIFNDSFSHSLALPKKQVFWLLKVPWISFRVFSSWIFLASLWGLLSPGIFVENVPSKNGHYFFSNATDKSLIPLVIYPYPVGPTSLIN